jgi:hypothetical protein
VATVQEEVGLYGAMTAAYGVAPTAAVAMDGTFARQHDVGEREGVELDKGPAIGIGPNFHPWMVRRLRELAEAVSNVKPEEGVVKEWPFSEWCLIHIGVCDFRYIPLVHKKHGKFSVRFETDSPGDFVLKLLTLLKKRVEEEYSKTFEEVREKAASRLLTKARPLEVPKEGLLAKLLRKVKTAPYEEFVKKEIAWRKDEDFEGALISWWRAEGHRYGKPIRVSTFNGDVVEYVPVRVKLSENVEFVDDGFPVLAVDGYEVWVEYEDGTELKLHFFKWKGKWFVAPL